ncbi:MAG: DUF2207 domain-containing protein [Gemmatimonadota bacterium]
MSGSGCTGLLLGILLVGFGPGPSATPSTSAAAGELAGPTVATRTIAPSARSWRIEDFHSEVRVLATGAIEVSERLRVRFDGSFNGIYRTIPIEYRDTRNFNVSLRLEVAGVEDGSGAPLRYESSRERQYRKIKIWVPGAEDASRTVVIRYRAENALLHFTEDELEWDELYWNVTGDEWPVPIDASSVRVQLPAEVTGIRARAFTGRYGSTDTGADLSVD